MAGQIPAAHGGVAVVIKLPRWRESVWCDVNRAEVYCPFCEMARMTSLLSGV